MPGDILYTETTAGFPRQEKFRRKPFLTRRIVMKKRIIGLGLAAILALAPAAVSAESIAEEVPAADPEIIEAPADGDTKIVVGATPSPHAEILAQVKDALAEKGWTLEIVEYTDYIQPNMALQAGDLDANYFQHVPYLESFNEENKTDLVSACIVHYEPFGLFAGKTASLEEIGRAHV